MRLQHMLRYLRWLGILAVAVLFLAGCIEDPPSPLRQIGEARSALDAAKEKGAGDRFPDDFAALEQKYLETRGVYYSCNESGAGTLAQALISDANALANRPLQRLLPPPPPSSNQSPVARLTAPLEGRVNTSSSFDASGSFDPEGRPLTYYWDFGDGATIQTRTPFATHEYTQPGNYVVRMTVDDGAGGTDTAASTLAAIAMATLSDRVGQALFDSNRATLKPQAITALQDILGYMRDQPTLRVELVGHADSIGSEQYNLRLSQRRAEAVRDYLVSRGVSPSNISTNWVGESQPIASNATRQGRAQNRRVEVTVRPASLQ